MKKYLSWITLIFIIACHHQPVAREMSALEVMGQINNDFCLLIDIREKGSFTKIINPSLWIPFTDIEKNQNDLSNLLPKNIHDKTIVVYSDQTELSIQACQIFSKVNYKCNYLKNFSVWEESHLPTKLMTF